MATLRVASYIILPVILGALSYHLYSEQRFADMVLLAFMGCLILMFMGGEAAVEERFEADAKRAEHEDRDWRRE